MTTQEVLEHPEVAAPAALSVAVLVPCLNEAPTIGQVVEDFRAALPGAVVYVYDNASADDTATLAIAAGAVVRHEPRPGKGVVLRRMFADIEADVYVVVDGDATYHAPAATAMVDAVAGGVDMVVGCRAPVDDSVHRRGHSAGNAAFTRLTRLLFGGTFTDVFSGYRAFSRRFVKSFPGRAGGFDIEIELTAHARQIEATVQEVRTPYIARHEDSASKLRTGRDGIRILFRAVRLFERMRPVQFFGGWFAALSFLALALGTPIVLEFQRTGLVPRYPTAILAAAIQIVAFICLTAGLVLGSVHEVQQENRRLAYLAVPGPIGRASSARS